MKALLIGFATVAMSTDLSSAQIIPDGIIIENYQGGWRRGGSDLVQQCLRHFNAKYPTYRIQIIRTWKDARCTGWHGRHREHRYGYTAALEEPQN